MEIEFSYTAGRLIVPSIRNKLGWLKFKHPNLEISWYEHEGWLQSIFFIRAKGDDLKPLIDEFASDGDAVIGYKQGEDMKTLITDVDFKEFSWDHPRVVELLRRNNINVNDCGLAMPRSRTRF